MRVIGMLGPGACTCSMIDSPNSGGPGTALDLGQTPVTKFGNLSTSPTLSNKYTISAWLNLRSGGALPTPRVAIVSSTNCSASVEFLVLGATTNISGPQYLQLARCNVFGGPLSTGTVPLHQWA